MEYSQIKPLAWRLVKELIKRPSREEETHRKSTVSRGPPQAGYTEVAMRQRLCSKGNPAGRGLEEEMLSLPPPVSSNGSAC